MKAVLNIITRYASLILVAAFVFSSCSQDVLDNVNNHNDHPKNVEAKYILAEVITSTAFHNIGGDLNTYLSAYIEHEVGIHNQLYRAEIRMNEPSSSSTFNNVWMSLYSALRDARIVIDKCSKGGSQEGNLVTRGIAKVLAAYNSALITDMFGDAPWSEAALIQSNGLPVFMTPKIDRQEDIYKEIMRYLDSAITDLQGTDSHFSGSVGNYDLLYGGNKTKWLKLAYGLKARYTLRLLATTLNKNAELDKILEYVSKSFTSVADQAALDIYDASNYNPLFDFQWSRDALAASESLADKLIERNDPRLRRVFVNADWVQIEDEEDDEFFVAPNGTPEQIQYYYNTSIFVYSQVAPTMFMSYHELLFIKAEVLARKGDIAAAKDVLREAVIAGIANTEANVDAAFAAPDVNYYGGLEETTDAISEEEAEEYFDTEVAPLFDDNPLKEIMIQKYLAFFGASGESTEAYNDIRRLKAMGEDFISLANNRRFPLRCGYGNSSTTTNPSIKEAFGDGQYVYTENVWWAGGKR